MKSRQTVQFIIWVGNLKRNIYFGIQWIKKPHGLKKCGFYTVFKRPMRILNKKYIEITVILWMGFVWK